MTNIKFTELEKQKAVCCILLQAKNAEVEKQRLQNFYDKMNVYDAKIEEELDRYDELESFYRELADKIEQIIDETNGIKEVI